MDTYDRSFNIEAQSATAEITNVTFDRLTVTAGTETINVEITISNTGNQARTFWIGASSIVEGGTDWHDWEPARQDVYVSPEMSGSVTLSWSPEGTVSPGTYGFYSKIYLESAGADFVNEYWQAAVFTVEAQQVELTGRIAFHRDSDNRSLHTPVNEDDGNVFIYNLNSTLVSNETQVLSIGNCMNPHFAPDGSALTFMGIPPGEGLSWANMRIFVFDLAEDTLVNLGVGQDPKFSADGQMIVYKKSEQLWQMNRNGSTDILLTSSEGEKSGPNYAPVIDDGRIVYWKTYWVGSSKRGDIAMRHSNGTEQTLVYGTDTQYCYYPIWRDADRILYTVSEGSDDLYEFVVSTSSNTALPSPINSPSEDADPFPVNDLIGFSSTRVENSGGGYDLYIANSSGSVVQEISQVSSSLHELGGFFTPYGYARKLKVHAPTGGDSIEQGTSYVLKVRAFSDGGVWSGVDLTVTLSGPVTETYTGLNDNGVSGDQTAGDGVYSRMISLPSASGTYAISATAVSLDNELQNDIVSENLSIMLYHPTGSLQVTIVPQGAIDAGAQWRRVGTTTWHNNGFSESDIPGGEYTVEFSDIDYWTTPSNHPVTIVNNETSTFQGAYTQEVGSILVIIDPQSARDAGAQWRIDEGPWRNTGVTNGGIPVGEHTVDFKQVNCWTVPNPIIVQINADENSQINGTYEQDGKPIAPNEIVSPLENDTIITASVNLVWRAVAEADNGYVLEIDTTSLFDSPRLWTDTLELLTDTTIEKAIESDGTYFWRLSSLSVCGQGEHSQSWSFVRRTPTWVVEISSSGLPADFTLGQNYPNPFNPETRIEFELPRGTFVTIDVFNILGARVRRLVSENLPAGRMAITWDGRDDNGGTISSGIYLYRISTSEFVDTKKMIMLK